MTQTSFPNAQTQTVVIPANSSVPIWVRGSTICVISTTAAFKACPNDGTATIELDNGLSYVCPDDLEFDMVTFKNETGVAITTKVFIGKGRISDARLTLQSGSALNVQNVAGTKLVVGPNATTNSNVVYALTNAAATLVQSASSSTQECIFQNTGAGDLYIGSSSVLATLKATGLILSPREKMIVQGGSAIYCASESSVGEVRKFVVGGV